jgi:hypothetical protein
MDALFIRDVEGRGANRSAGVGRKGGCLAERAGGFVVNRYWK